MKISLINNFFNPGGATKVSYSLAENLSQSHQMQFYGFLDGSYREKFGELGETFLLKGCQFDYGKDLIYNLEKFNPDIIHIFIPGEQNPSYFKKLPPCKKFITVLCEQNIGFDPTIFERVFFLSEYSKGFCGNIKNGICIRPSIETNVAEKEQARIPAIGRISAFCPSKLIDHTILCAANNKNFMWTIAGEIQDENCFRNAMKAKTKLELSNLNIRTNLNEEEKLGILRSSDIWHYPTSSETFCFSILDAFAARKPVISYQNSAIPELFDNSEWLAKDIEDLQEKTHRMISLSAKERTCIGNNNYERYLKNSSSLFTQRTEYFYSNTGV